MCIMFIFYSHAVISGVCISSLVAHESASEMFKHFMLNTGIIKN